MGLQPNIKITSTPTHKPSCLIYRPNYF